MTLIKKIIAIFAVLISFFISGNINNVSLSLEDPVDISTQKIVVNFKNETGKYITQPYLLSFEKYNDGEWEEIGHGDYPMTEMAKRILPTEEGKISINLKQIGIDSLSEGNYRITIAYNVIFNKTNKLGSTDITFEI